MGQCNLKRKKAVETIVIGLCIDEFCVTVKISSEAEQRVDNVTLLLYIIHVLASEKEKSPHVAIYDIDWL